MKITNLKAFQVYDSRGYPTIACMIEIDNNIQEISMVPSGASTGEREALELRDNISTEWAGKGILKAIKNVNEIIKPVILGKDPLNQFEIDRLMIELDGTKNKNKLGANAILSVSLAVAKAASRAINVPLFKYIKNNIINWNDSENFYPIPIVNVINGGKHANNNLDFQEFMFIPLKSKNWQECLKIVDECFLSLQQILTQKGLSIAKGDEGGFSVNFDSIEEVFELLSDAIKKSGYKVGEDVGFGIDVAASEFYVDNVYKLKIIDKELDSVELLEFYNYLIKKYPIVYLEDPFDQNDWESFKKLTSMVNKDVLIVGDDLYCTNSKLLSKGIDNQSTNSILIKLNQIGTLTECLETIKLAKENNFNYIISHRSGETEDSFIADLSIATSSRLIKTGSMSRSERLAKYNRITIIDEIIEKLSSSDWEEICQK